ncbi:MAG: D-methionine transport system permease protein [Moorella sp. (in: firmicutes)]|jgi:D-methionine transport system permease protein|uniref:methionine ABC transporter permease n=1 Tax=unclassified Neomoorella TaxID=2676739 RepID=UPI0010FFB78A|nr:MULTISPECIES: methionine ABC transporter permease [unclassified Moorella (in: firmicutes)]MDK2815916.1 D-methionine transport system permease protein [Moorella sp. (in: firmicutes)]MDK2894619.1 D-methionine transport system permease protein [Moorella sp. (in: firmicutes)]GEA13921.1 methionine ABC transporter permease [Moorella sp. E308F]GEA18706.1 methionine ABC transporter permease [Moorella sp. E306M]
MSNWLDQIIPMVTMGTLETLYMVFVSVFIAYLFGLPLGVILLITSEKHIKPSPLINSILGTVINIGRSFPFIILLIAIIPFTRLVVGTFIGTTASIVPLSVGAIPFVARLVETSLREIPWGVIEAAQSMGASPWQIIVRVMLPEATPSLVSGFVLTTITLIGYSAMAGVVGGGGLGTLAYQYGFQRYQNDVMVITVVLLIIMVQIIQVVGDRIVARLSRR